MLLNEFSLENPYMATSLDRHAEGGFQDIPEDLCKEAFDRIDWSSSRRRELGGSRWKSALLENYVVYLERGVTYTVPHRYQLKWGWTPIILR
jgi:hypothetical protein